MARAAVVRMGACRCAHDADLGAVDEKEVGNGGGDFLDRAGLEEPAHEHFRGAKCFKVAALESVGAGSARDGGAGVEEEVGGVVEQREKLSRGCGR